MLSPDKLGNEGAMEHEQGFSMVELLIVVAIIAIIAGMAVPQLMTVRMAANETAAIVGCRSIGSAEITYSMTSGQKFTNLTTLVSEKLLDSRFDGGSIDGYRYSANFVASVPVPPPPFDAAGIFLAKPTTADSTGRFNFVIGADQVVRYMGVAGSAVPMRCGASPCSLGDPLNK
jgi:prepilin-type N-terminal cleavage/methylation domain-containing protein